MENRKKNLYSLHQRLLQLVESKGRRRFLSSSFAGGLFPFYFFSPWWVDVWPYKYTNSAEREDYPEKAMRAMGASSSSTTLAACCDVQKAFEDTDHKGYK